MVRLRSLPLDEERWQALVRVAEAYTRQKDAFLAKYADPRYLHYLARKEELRRRLRAAGFVSPFGLPEEMWEAALAEALALLEGYWEAAVAKVRDLVASRKVFGPRETDYVLWLLGKGGRAVPWERLREVFAGADIAPRGLELPARRRQSVQRCLGCLLRRFLGRRPRARRASGFLLPPGAYQVLATEKRQYLAVPSLEAGRRVLVPLARFSPLCGSLRLVLLPRLRAVEVARGAAPGRVVAAPMRPPRKRQLQRREVNLDKGDRRPR